MWRKLMSAASTIGDQREIHDAINEAYLRLVDEP
jgi:hypothetical protein